jgi:hypothetical protein
MRLPSISADAKAAVRTWLIVLLIAAWMLAWAAGAFFLIGDRLPGWSYGTPAVVPGDSYYTTGKPPAGPAPQQVPTAPLATEATP